MSTDSKSPYSEPTGFTRSELRAIEAKALEAESVIVNEGWKEAYHRLASACNILDAFKGRSKVWICPKCHPITPPADCTADQAPQSAPALGNPADL